jgi:hypothetical protein
MARAGVGVPPLPLVLKDQDESGESSAFGQKSRREDEMLRKKAALLAALSLGMALTVSSYAQTPATSGKPAPAGFDNKPNGFENDQFGKNRDKFENVEKIDDGLGPVYNSTACVGCHQNPVTGSSSQTSEIRAGHRELKSI